MENMTLTLAGCAFALGCATVAKVMNGRRKKNITKHGPAGDDKLGNLRQISETKPFLTLTDWAREFGDIYFLRLGTQQAVVLNSVDVAKEVMMTNGKSVAGRPLFNTMSIMHDKERRFIFAKESDEWSRRYRSTVLGDIHKRQTVLDVLAPEQVDKMAAALFKDGQSEVVADVSELMHKAATNMAHGYAFGHTYDDLLDPELTRWVHALSEYRDLLFWFRDENFVAGTSTSEFEQRVARFREATSAMFADRITTARKQRLEDPNADIGLTGALLQMFESSGDADDVNEVDVNITSILRDVMFSASDGGFQPLLWALLYAVRDPAVLCRLQEELDSVVGRDAEVIQPALRDRDRLPYVEAMVREVLRCSDITTLGIPRRATEDLTVRGHLINRDTLIIVNSYAIHRDARRWAKSTPNQTGDVRCSSADADPMQFCPERFFAEDGVTLRPASEFSFLPFCAGVRQCVGQNLVRGFLLLLVARFFQRFDVAPAPGESAPEFENTGGAFNPELKPFKVKLTLRG